MTCGCRPSNAEPSQGLRAPGGGQLHVRRPAAGRLRCAQLSALRKQSLVVHNVGQACRFCTPWADGINGVLPILRTPWPSFSCRRARLSFRETSRVHGTEGAAWPPTTEGTKSASRPGLRVRTTCPARLSTKDRGIRCFDGIPQHWATGIRSVPSDALRPLPDGFLTTTPQCRYWLPPKQMEDSGVKLLEKRPPKTLPT